jgi:hypothetical protein
MPLAVSDNEFRINGGVTVTESFPKPMLLKRSAAIVFILARAKYDMVHPWVDALSADGRCIDGIPLRRFPRLGFEIFATERSNVPGKGVARQTALARERIIKPFRQN